MNMVNATAYLKLYPITNVSFWCSRM